MITNIQYKKWLSLSTVICNNKDTAYEVLHELLLSLLESETPDSKLNDNYIFISLRNRYLKHLHKESRYNGGIPSEEGDEDVTDHVKDAENILSKLKSVENVVLNLRQYEQELYKLHFIYGISQREISRETSISMRSINNSINKIKFKIQEHYEEKK